MAMDIKQLKYLEWAYVFEAVMQIVEENQRAAAGTYEAPADSDDWTRSSALRQKLWTRTRAAWSHLCGEPEHRFPWASDGVCEIYMKIRKRSAEDVAGYRKSLAILKGERGLASGHKANDSIFAGRA